MDCASTETFSPPVTPLASREWVEGFRAVMPLWLGLVPFALAFAVLARGAGLSVLEAQAMSLIVFAGGSQFSAVGLIAAGAGSLEVILATAVLNARHLLYGLSLSLQVPMTGAQRAVASFLLTDEAYGVALARRGGPTFPYLLGAELSVFIPWNLATLVGALAGGAMPAPEALGVDFVFPLAFLALLVPRLRDTASLAVAGVAGALALGLSHWLPSGVALLAGTLVGSGVGAWLTRGEVEAVS
jgi:4-azaleucine resistance transporter AzlC